MKKNDNKKEYLPLFGIGPGLCFPVAVITIAAIILSAKRIIPGQITNNILNVIFTVIGILLIIEGVILFIGADMGSNLQDDIKTNILKTNGSYKFVRNPCYVMFLLVCTGAIFISHNILLFILPFLFWIEMTVVLINTEEKWLRDLYGQEYIDYCKRVNRCIPWFSKK